MVEHLVGVTVWACVRVGVCADLLVGLISVNTDLVWHITVKWYAGNAVCKLVRVLQVLPPFCQC